MKFLLQTSMKSLGFHNVSKENVVPSKRIYFLNVGDDQKSPGWQINSHITEDGGLHFIY